MGKTILNLIMTFDGYIAGTHEEIDWIDKVDERSKKVDKERFDFPAFLSKLGAIIMGKGSYNFGIKKGLYKDQPYGKIPIFVLTHHPEKNPLPETDFRFVTTGIHDTLKQAKKAAGDKGIWVFGGASIVQQMLNENMVDEFQITIAPMMIGKGIRLFENLKERHIELEKIHGKIYESGMIEIHYKVIK